jgi:signal peptidase I
MNPITRFWTWLRSPKKSKFGQLLETIIIVVPIAFVIRTYFYGLYQVPTGSMETTMLVGERFFADKFTPFFSTIKRGDIITFNDPSYQYSDNPAMNIFQRYVWGPMNWTKRVIGMPGDHVEGKIEDGKPVVYLNGEKLHEPYLNKYPLIGVYYPNEPSNPLHYRSYDPEVSYEDQPFYRMNSQAVTIAKRLMERYGWPWQKLPGTPAIEHDFNGDIYDVVLGNNQYWVMGDNRLGSLDSRFGFRPGGVATPLDGTLIHGKILLRLWSMDSTESWWIVDLFKHPIDFWKRIRWSRCLQWVS